MKLMDGIGDYMNNVTTEKIEVILNYMDDLKIYNKGIYTGTITNMFHSPQKITIIKYDGISEYSIDIYKDMAYHIWFDKYNIVKYEGDV